MIKQVVLVAILLAATISIVGLEQQSALAGTSSQNRAVGFQDGCNGVPLTEGHTQSYLDGYSEGQAQCHGNGSSGGGDSGSDNGGGSSDNGGGRSSRSNGGESTNLVDKVCNFAQTNPRLASLAAVALGYPGLDTAVQALCGLK